MHEHRVAKILSMFKVLGLLLLCPKLWDCILVYEHIKHINKAFISKAVLLTSCKRGRKFQLNSAYSWFSDTKQTASWKLPTVIQNICLISVLKQSITSPHLEPNKCSTHIPKLIQHTFQYHPYINGYDFHKVSCLRISKRIWHPKHNTKPEIVKCNLTISYSRQ
jgi:hypothetical protein